MIIAAILAIMLGWGFSTKSPSVIRVGAAILLVLDGILGITYGALTFRGGVSALAGAFLCAYVLMGLAGIGLLYKRESARQSVLWIALAFCVVRLAHLGPFSWKLVVFERFAAEVALLIVGVAFRSRMMFEHFNAKSLSRAGGNG